MMVPVAALLPAGCGTPVLTLLTTLTPHTGADLPPCTPCPVKNSSPNLASADPAALERARASKMGSPASSVRPMMGLPAKRKAIGRFAGTNGRTRPSGPRTADGSGTAGGRSAARTSAESSTAPRTPAGVASVDVTGGAATMAPLGWAGLGCRVQPPLLVASPPPSLPLASSPASSRRCRATRQERPLEHPLERPLPRSLVRSLPRSLVRPLERPLPRSLVRRQVLQERRRRLSRTPAEHRPLRSSRAAAL